MKNLVFGIVLFVFCVANQQTLVAQPRLGVNTIPSAPASFILYPTSNGVVNPGVSGPNVTWDYTTLLGVGTPAIGNNIRYISINEFPAEARDSFPTAQTGVTEDTILTAFRVEGNTVRNLGTSSPKTNVTTTTVDPYDSRPTEIVFNGSHIDLFKANVFDKQLNRTLKRSGRTELTYTGFGTLLLPQGTVIPNAARLTRVTTTTDTLRSGPAIFTYRTITTQHTWQPATSNVIVLEMTSISTTQFRNNVQIGQTVTTQSVRSSVVRDEISSTVDEEQATVGSVYPTPVTSGVLHIKNIAFEVATVHLIDAQGNQFEVDAQQQGDQVTANVASLASGAYTVVIASNNSTQNAKRITASALILR